MTNTEPGTNPKAGPLPPSTAWEEEFEVGEEELFKGFAREIEERQDRELRKIEERRDGSAREKEVAERVGGRLLRGFHAKPHAGLVAEFEVLPDLPAHARFGVFAEPRVFPAVVRFSNGTPTIKDDKETEPRGLAVKLFGVPGKKLLPEQEDAVTQDFLATSHSVTQTVRNVRQFMVFVRAEEEGVPRLILSLLRRIGLRETWRILRAINGTVRKPEVRSMATEVYSGTAPVKLGPYAVKFTLKPGEGTRPAAGDIPEDSPDFLREDLAERLRKADLVFDFVVQFFVNKELTPIEDTSVPWHEGVTPFVSVARLRIPKCELDQKLSDEVNGYSFTPWHAIEEHKPLGNVMRARRFAYEASAAHRGHRPEPTGPPL